MRRDSHRVDGNRLGCDPTPAARTWTSFPIGCGGSTARHSNADHRVDRACRRMSRSWKHKSARATDQRRGRRNDQGPGHDQDGFDRDGAACGTEWCAGGAVRYVACGLRCLEARVQRGGEGQGRRRHRDRGADADQLRVRHHRRRSRSAQLPAVARPVPGQARGRCDRCARPAAEAVAGGDVRLHRAALRRAAGPVDRDLGHGERVRQPARQPAHAVVDRDAGL